MTQPCPPLAHPCPLVVQACRPLALSHSLFTAVRAVNSCCLWFNYGLLVSDTTLLAVNSIGIGYNVYYIYTFYTFSSSKVVLPSPLSFLLCIRFSSYFVVISSSLSFRPISNYE